MFALLALLGCRHDYETFTTSLSLVVSLDDPSPTAGDEVHYLAYLEGGDEPVAIEVELSSDLEPLLSWGDGVIVPTVAGPHALVATAHYDKDGNDYFTTVDMDVAAGPPAGVDLMLSDIQVEAGQSITTELAAWDAYGNPTATTTVTLSADGDTLQGDGSLLSTVPGLFHATASAGEASDTESFVVVAGPPAELDLRLSDTDLELADTTIASVVVTDAYGNEVDEDWLLWTDPATTDIDYNAITFLSEGTITVWASTEDGALTDSVGPLLIDSTGPILDVFNPERGTRTTDAGQYVGGTASDEYSGVSSITVNGEAASIGSDGSWESWQDYEFGVTTLETVAVDGDGNASNDLRAVMSGEYNPYGDGVGDGIQARVNESGFDTLEGMAEGFIDISTIESAIPSPVFSDSSKTCVWSVCVTWYSIDFYLENPSISGTDLNLDPTSAGTIDTTATIYDAYLEYRAKGKLVGISYSASGSIAADEISLNMDMTPYVSSGQLGVTVSNASASTKNFDFDLDSWIYDVVEFFGIDVDGIIEGYLVDALASMAEDQVPDLFADAVQDLEIGTTLDIEGNTYDLDAVPYSVSVDDAGLTLGLETWFTTSSWLSGFAAEPGSLVYPYTPPSYSSSPGMILGLNQDFLNQALFALWGGGVLDMTLTGDSLGLDPADLSMFLPGLTDLSIATVAYLPPVVVPGTGTELLDLQLGDLELSLYNGAVDEANLYMRVYVTVVAGLELSATTDNTLKAGLGDMEISFDLVYPNERGIHAGEAEAFLETLVPMLLPSLTSALGEIPIPDLSGFTLSGVTVGLDGAEDGYVTLGGNLKTAP